jgi:hypothetical protein
MCRLTLQHRGCFFFCAEAFYFHAVPLISSFSEMLKYWISIHKVITYAYVIQYIPYFFPGVISPFQIWFTLNCYWYKVRDWDLVSIFCKWISNFPSTICWTHYFFHQCMFWAFVIKCLQLLRFVSGSFILFHWFSCLFLCQNHAVFVTMALCYSCTQVLWYPSFTLFAQYCLGYSWSFVLSYEL